MNHEGKEARDELQTVRNLYQKLVSLAVSLSKHLFVPVHALADGGDFRAEEGHMVMWHDSGVTLPCQIYDLFHVCRQSLKKW